MPVLMLQLFFAFEYLWHQRNFLVVVVGLSTVYLWMVDTIAIGNGAWSISEEATTGILLNPSLPLEEALFFLLTNCMVACGLCAAERTFSILDVDPRFAGQKWSWRIVLEATFSNEFEIDSKVVLDLQACCEIISEASTSFYLSTLLLPVSLRYKVKWTDVDMEIVRLCTSL
jgi:15-cis-phytoene synthase/lycopene beta-cyclase